MLKSPRWRTFIVLVIFLGACIATVWFVSRWRKQNRAVVTRTESPNSANATAEATPQNSPAASPELPTSIEPPTPSPGASTSPSPPETSPSPTPQSGFVGTLHLIIPVAGVTKDQLIDTFTDARSEGRVHDAIDIPAPQGTPVLAVADGEIVKLFQSDKGGTTIYQLSSDRQLIYYYAHLQGYRDGLTEGQFVRQGEVIGFVGDTGNAGPGNYHLHFSIAIVSDPKRYWEGTNVNPYPLLGGR
jgi:peptidoglycan LD-endopeptidase LytH